MTPQEFRQIYLDTQDQLGNNLQALTSLVTQFSNVIEQLSQDYENLNVSVETFIDQLEDQPGDQ